MWVQFNSNFCIIHCFRVITYGNKIQNTLRTNPGKLNRTKGGGGGYDQSIRLAPLQQRANVATTKILRNFLRAPFNDANFQ